MVALGGSLTHVRSPPGTGTPGHPAWHNAPEVWCHGILESHVRHPRGLTGAGQTESVSKVSWQSRARRLGLATSGAGDGGHCDVNSVTLTLAPASPSVTAGERPSATADKIPGPTETASPGTSGAGPTPLRGPRERRWGLDSGPSATALALSRKSLQGQAAHLLASGSHDPPRAS